MQRSLKVLGLTLVASAVALALAIPAMSATTKVLFPADCGKPTYKPTKIVVTCGDANNVVTKIKWESYGTKAASGTGTALVNDCDPNCASGKAKKFPVVVTLTTPKNCGGGITQFTRLVETFTDAKPKSAGSKIRQPFPCPGHN
jgi:hypothetical protein